MYIRSTHIRIMQEAKVATCKQQNTVQLKCNLMPACKAHAPACACAYIHDH